MKKMSLIGAGHIGGTLAHLAALREMAEIHIMDLFEGVAEGKSLDLSQTMAPQGISNRLSGGGVNEGLKNSDVVIITAGSPRQPGMSRDDLLVSNAKVVQGIGKKIKQYCPDAFVIVVTNPLDAMVGVLQHAADLPTHKVVGMAGVLDTSRFRYFLSQALNVSIEDVQALVLGGHGDLMVPLTRYVSISGIPLHVWIENGDISQDEIDSIVQRTRDGGAEIVKLLEKGSAYYAPATAAIEMAESYLKDQKRLLPCAAWLNGEYGIQGLYAGVPVVLGKDGVERIIEVDLNTFEKDQFTKSIDTVKVLNTILHEKGLL